MCVVDIGCSGGFKADLELIDRFDEKDG